ncbi:hypothetical protein LguiB_005930 [Lonicera macranthoides]
MAEPKIQSDKIEPHACTSPPKALSMGPRRAPYTKLGTSTLNTDGLGCRAMLIDKDKNPRFIVHGDMIRSSSSFYSTMVVHGILNDDPHMLNYKDRAWKFKRNFIEFHMFDSKSLNDDHAFHGIAKDWAWKFKRVELQGGPLE